MLSISPESEIGITEYETSVKNTRKRSGWVYFFLSRDPFNWSKAYSWKKIMRYSSYRLKPTLDDL